MHKSVFGRRGRGLGSFTLIELLTVIAIIAILAALTLFAGEGVMKAAARNRAKSEIQGMGAALESYKTDNGSYPLTTRTPVFNGTASYPSSDGSVLGGPYQVSAQELYEALAGKTNFLDVPDPNAGVKTYYNFTIKQLGNYTTPQGESYGASSSTYVQDPFGFAYGYNTGDNPTAGPQVNPPNSGPGFYDLWSTGGILQATLATNPTLTNTWIANWPQ